MGRYWLCCRGQLYISLNGGLTRWTMVFLIELQDHILWKSSLVKSLVHTRALSRSKMLLVRTLNYKKQTNKQKNWIISASFIFASYLAISAGRCNRKELDFVLRGESRWERPWRAGNMIPLFCKETEAKSNCPDTKKLKVLVLFILFAMRQFSKETSYFSKISLDFRQNKPICILSGWQGGKLT